MNGRQRTHRCVLHVRLFAHLDGAPVVEQDDRLREAAPKRRGQHRCVAVQQRAHVGGQVLQVGGVGRLDLWVRVA